MSQIIQVEIDPIHIVSFFVVALSFLICWHKIVQKNQKKIIRPVSYDVLNSIRKRRSIFPKHYRHKTIPKEIVESLIDAAMWAPYHGTRPPWYFIILDQKAAVKMQHLTLEFYDNNWKEKGFKDRTKEEYQSWRNRTEGEITGRWASCSYMIAIVVKTPQPSDKILPEWEEISATACAVQNMHIQLCSYPEIGGYWSSWHSDARDSDEMKSFFGLLPTDKLLGFFVIAGSDPDSKDRRQRIERRSEHCLWMTESDTQI